jgi:endonuclease/exonuclease/phosphatase family metal-dependent hydrolase
MNSLSKASLVLLAIAGAAWVIPIDAKGPGSPPAMPNVAETPSPGSLSVLTYNVHGLPWPFATDRPAAFRQIAARLAAMRAEGTAPQIVVMQEAFTDAAVRIGKEAGYPYIVQGPNARQRDADADGATDAAFLAQARWNRGETEGPLLDSGLVILSDYPILSARTVAYPRDACAGYDCLANKGAVLARVAVPGLSSPVDIVTTHLNCRERTGVSIGRADEAYQRELATLTDFIARTHDPDLPMIVAGDFNVGRAASRMTAVASAIDKLHARPALATMVSDHAALPADAFFSWRKNKDLQLAVSSATARVSVQAIATPFGHDNGGMLSDHVGYVVRYRIVPSAVPSNETTA